MKFSIPITTSHFSRLEPGRGTSSWLSDELINFYMQLLSMRDQETAASNPRHIRNHFFNSFLMATLRPNRGAYEYKRVQRWTKTFDLFSLNKVFIPINIDDTHWTLAVIDMTNKVIRYYDSSGGAGREYLGKLLDYVKDEWTHKKRTSPPAWMSEWRLIEGSQSTPQQHNSYDCGVFVLCSADLLAQDLPLLFDQQDLQAANFRARIGYSILHQQLHL